MLMQELWHRQKLLALHHYALEQKEPLKLVKTSHVTYKNIQSE